MDFNSNQFRANHSSSALGRGGSTSNMNYGTSFNFFMGFPGAYNVQISGPAMRAPLPSNFPTAVAAQVRIRSTVDNQKRFADSSTSPGPGFTAGHDVTGHSDVADQMRSRGGMRAYSSGHSGMSQAPINSIKSFQTEKLSNDSMYVNTVNSPSRPTMPYSASPPAGSFVNTPNAENRLSPSFTFGPAPQSHD